MELDIYQAETARIAAQQAASLHETRRILLRSHLGPHSAQ